MMNTEALKTVKFLVNMRHKTDPRFNGEPFDVVIPVMGPTGVGKSTFINSLLESIGEAQPAVIVGHGLQSCTSHLNPIVIKFGHEENGFTNPNSDNKGRLVIVDTPGFDDTYEDDAEILRRISVWLGLSYVTKMTLGGVIYLHDITQTRMLGTTRRNLSMFRKLVGDNALKCVVLGTTKWKLVEAEIGAQRQRQLKADFWKDMIKAGSQVVGIDDHGAPQVVNVHDRDTPRLTPREVVNQILKRVKIIKSKAEFLLMIQSELGQLRRFIPQTDAGQTLKYSLEQLIQLQKRKVKNLTDEDYEKGREELERLLKTVKDLKVPLGARIKRFFNL